MCKEKKSIKIKIHGRILNKIVIITTIIKTNRTQFKMNELKLIAEGFLKRTSPKWNEYNIFKVLFYVI